MKKLSFNRLKGLLLAAFCIMLLFPGMDTYALTTRQKAMNAYADFLSKSKIYVMAKGIQYNRDDPSQISSGYPCTAPIYTGTPKARVNFALAYIDSDSIPELVVMTGTGDARVFGIFSYKNGKMVRIYSTRGYDFVSGYYKKTGVFLDRYYNEGSVSTSVYYKMSGATYIRSGNYRFRHNIHLGDNRFVGGCKRGGSMIYNKTTYLNQLHTITKGQKCLRFSFHTNTAANRKSILK